ncbi:hypothetical protein Acsp03_00240 [Actinomadura sp. NBRC 104412]|nr:hypothetical protein Acsp03_00240 [Actinomadura sp. NBRC 104412]
MVPSKGNASVTARRRRVQDKVLPADVPSQVEAGDKHAVEMFQDGQALDADAVAGAPLRGNALARAAPCAHSPARHQSGLVTIFKARLA